MAKTPKTATTSPETPNALHAAPMARIPIGQLHPAAYNPRKISAAAKVGLRNAIDRFGVVQPIVWNKRTGNIVGGHQRFEVLKDMGAEAVDVVTVDLNDADERALNLSLNNNAIQGEWDDGKLEDMLADMIALPDFSSELVHDIRLDTILAKFTADDIDLSGFFDEGDEEKPPAPPSAIPPTTFKQADYGTLEGADVDSQLEEMTAGVRKAIQIEFDPEHYEAAKAEVKFWRERGENIGLMFLAFLAEARKAHGA